MRLAVEREIVWQLRQCFDHSLMPAHIDSHQHVHVFGGVWQTVLRLARENDIRRVRVPWCPNWSAIKKNVGGIALQTLSARLGKHVYWQYLAWMPILGVANAGHNTVEIYERELELAASGAERKAVPTPDIELCVHPGVNTPELEQRYRDWRFNWTGERDALLSPRFRQAVTRHGFSLAAIEPPSPAARTDTSRPRWRGAPPAPSRQASAKLPQAQLTSPRSSHS
jgi:predicted glycoside hydrolase/deacetylase ChbG (UPF0249 family)